MGTPNIYVGPSIVVPILQNNHPATVIANEGTTTCYLDNSSNVSELSYDYALRPGDAITWLENVPCYAISNPLAATSISITTNVTIFGGLRLYTATNAPAVISGGTVTQSLGTDGKLYNFHRYTATDATGIVCTTTGRARVLIIGGAGGNGNDGGGGAGGYLDLLMDLYSGANYPIVIGAAGALGVAGTDGGWSYFGSIFALGGGGGGSSVVAGRDGASGGGADRTSNTFGLATLTYGRQGYNGAGSGGSNQNGGGGAASTGWVRNDGNPTDGRGGEGRQWLDGNWYSAGGNVGEDSTVTAGQTPYGSNATANSGCSGGGYLWTSAAGTVIVAIEVV